MPAKAKKTKEEIAAQRRISAANARAAKKEKREAEAAERLAARKTAAGAAEPTAHEPVPEAATDATPEPEPELSAEDQKLLQAAWDAAVAKEAGGAAALSESDVEEPEAKRSSRGERKKAGAGKSKKEAPDVTSENYNDDDELPPVKPKLVRSKKPAAAPASESDESEVDAKPKKVPKHTARKKKPPTPPSSESESESEDTPPPPPRKPRGKKVPAAPKRTPAAAPPQPVDDCYSRARAIMKKQAGPKDVLDVTREILEAQGVCELRDFPVF